MQAQANVFPIQTQVEGQTQIVGQTRVTPVQTRSQQRNNINGVGVLEIIFRVLCTVSDL